MGSSVYIGVSGYKGSGKSFFSNRIKDELSKFNHNVILESFARPLYEMVNIIVNEDVIKEKEYVFGDKVYTGRKILQLVGTQVMRNLNEDIWIELLLNRTKDSKDNFFVIEDVRFPNESEILDFHIHIENEGQIPEDVHESESFLSYLKEKADIVLARNNNEYRYKGEKVFLEEFTNRYLSTLRVK